MLRRSSAAGPAAALGFIITVGALGSEARAACVPRSGRRGSFPVHGDADIPSNSRFLFELASWPEKPNTTPSADGMTGVAKKDICPDKPFCFAYGMTEQPGDFHLLFPIGLYPLDKHPHSQYLYEFKPKGGTITPGAENLPYNYWLTFRASGSTKDEMTGAVFKVAPEADTAPPDFAGLLDLTTIHGSPEQTATNSGYDCILGEGTFTVAHVQFPKSEVKETSEGSRSDGVVFTSYAVDGSGNVGAITARSMVWPAEYNGTPVDWLFVVEQDPTPDAKRCFIVRATDAVGNEDQNTNVQCVIAPGPAMLPPGAGAPGFFGNGQAPNACAYGSGRPPAASGIALLVALASLMARFRQRRG